MSKKKKRKLLQLKHNIGYKVKREVEVRRPNITMSWMAYRQLYTMADMQGKNSMEYTAYAPVIDRDSGFYIPKLYAGPQENSTASTEAEVGLEVVSQIIADYPPEIDMVSKIKCHCHTHPSGINDFSSTDDKLAENWNNGTEDFLIMIMMTASKNVAARIEVYKPVRHTIPVKVSYELPVDDFIDDWKKTLEDNSKKEDVLATLYGKDKDYTNRGYYYGSWGEDYYDKKYDNYSFGFDRKAKENEEDDSTVWEDATDGLDEQPAEERDTILSNRWDMSFSLSKKCPKCHNKLSDFSLIYKKCSRESCSAELGKGFFDNFSSGEIDLLEHRHEVHETDVAYLESLAIREESSDKGAEDDAVNTGRSNYGG